ncbi:MAG TPA: type II toxin-antitoxin system VapC family toxin [Blastocatellia bacterium]|nr:type II toxin-antitoxin system VapC family toxin [Blastocatellia bacterium]
MSVYILDTNIADLLYRKHPMVLARLHALPPNTPVAATMITVGEALGGWLSQCRRASDGLARSRAYERLREVFDFYAALKRTSFTPEAAAIFDQLKAQKIRVGTNDLSIAAITLAVEGILVTRNKVDFERVPGLVFEDWTT